MGLPRLTFLIGAHKTASTHLQRSLLAQRKALSREGVGLIGPREVRVILKPLWEGDALPAEAAFALSEACPGMSHVVIMEENIPGTTARRLLYGPRGALYPQAIKRMERIRALFPGAEMRLGMAMRDCGSHLASCWAEELIHGPWRRFASYAEGVPVGVPQWAGLADRLSGVVPDLTLWRYEDHGALLPRLIDWATALPGFSRHMRPAAEGTPRSGPSHAAVRALEASMRGLPPGSDHRIPYRRARRRYPRPENPAFQPWTDEERAAFTAAYGDDLARILRNPDLRILLPEE